MTDKYQLPLLLYDDHCSLCKRFKDALARLPKANQLNMVPLSNDEVFNHFPKLNKIECYDKIHLIDEKNQLHVGGEVVNYLIKFYPGVSKFAWLADTGVGKKTLNFFYEVINEQRKKITKNCPGCNKGNH